MPRTITEEQQDFMQGRRFLLRERPHSMICLDGWDARLARINESPITPDSISLRELYLDMRDVYALYIIESFEQEARQ